MPFEKDKCVQAVALVRQLFVDARAEGCLHEAYTLLAALRGPDDDGYEVKTGTTCHIRAWLGCQGGVLFSSLAQARVAVEGAHNRHFQTHTLDALHVLQEAGVEAGEDRA